MRGSGSIWTARAEPKRGSAQGQCWFRNVGGSERWAQRCGSSWLESRLGRVRRGLFWVRLVNQLLVLHQPRQASPWVSLDSASMWPDGWVRFSYVGKKQTPSHPVTSLWCRQVRCLCLSPAMWRCNEKVPVSQVNVHHQKSNHQTPWFIHFPVSKMMRNKFLLINIFILWHFSMAPWVE